MKTNMKCFIPVSLLGVGLACLGLSSLLEKAGVPGWLGMLVFLISFNYVLASKTNLEGRFWSVINITKIHHIFIGILIGVIPVGLSCFYAGADLSFDPKFSLASIGVTLAIVSWEEFWFRGVLLDYAGKLYTQIGAAVVFSVVFVLLHALNPNLNLLEAAPDLFFGSMLLSISYFLFGSIWAPIGIHFANNYFESIWSVNGERSMVVMVLCEVFLLVAMFFVYMKKKLPKIK